MSHGSVQAGLPLARELIEEWRQNLSKYKMIERLGLELGSTDLARNFEPYVKVVLASSLEKLLSAAPVVYAHAIDGLKPDKPWSGPSQYGDTHTALLLGVQPIVKDTAESIVKWLAETNEFTFDEWTGLQARARALINKQKGEG